MSRARAPSGPSISLFPFLAVLLCTMGALLVLLVLFSRSANRGDAAAEAAARREMEEDLELARDELKWRLEQVQAVRDRTQADLSKARMQLAGTEETMRALADELESLERTAAALEAGQPNAADDEIADLERRLAESRKAVEVAKEAAADRPPAYAVVPYEGANGTHRRPLYIECCIDGVFLQPEGIRLGPADFEGPPGPGNPLASALRAAREHIARNPGESGDPNAQPYPLLLVRPSGVMAYYAAREAIQSWGSEFGYQFVDEEWEITYPTRDPALAEVEIRAVAEARRRLEWLAQVRPAKPARPATTYRAATTRGGVVSNGGPSVLGDQSRWDWTEEQAATAAQGRPGRGISAGDAAGNGGIGGDGSGGGDAILGGGGSGGSGFGSGAGSASGAGGPGRGVVAGGPSDPGGRYSGPSKFYSGSSAGGGEGGPDAGQTGEGGPAGGDLVATGAGGGAANRSGRFGGGSRFAGTAADAMAGDGAGGSEPAGSTAGGSGAAGAAGAAGGGNGGSGATASGGSGGGGGGSFGPSMPGLHQPGGASAGGGAAGSAGATASLAGARGSNWASLATQDRPVPLTRPIRLECAAEEFRILGEGGRVQSRIPIGTRTIDSIDPLVREVHATVGRWGIAGDRMYWRPELVLSATADGGGRRDDLERLLADSGIDTRRSGEVDKVRNLPPVQRTGGVLKRR